MNHIGFARSVLITTVLTFAFGLTTAQAGNSFIIGNLRVYIPEVYNVPDDTKSCCLQMTDPAQETIQILRQVGSVCILQNMMGNLIVESFLKLDSRLIGKEYDGLFMPNLG